MANKYVSSSGVIFAAIAVAHLYRATTGTSVMVGSSSVPLWVSWVAALVAGSFCVWALRSRR
jgi:hypothetical protein